LYINKQNKSLLKSHTNLIINKRGISGEGMPPVENNSSSTESFVQNLLATEKVVIFSKTTCPWCAKVKKLFDDLNEKYTVVELDKNGLLKFFFSKKII
jgi:hypothetical protein